mgnify:CR=1 FL=1
MILSGKKSQKRMFIAINLPDDIKDAIEKEIEKIRYEFLNDIRFIPRENWHITMTFLGYQKDESITSILDSMKNVSKEFEAQNIKLDNISYGPPKEPARMIWLNINQETSDNLIHLKNKLEDELADKNIRFQKEHRQPSIHITLARFGLTPIDSLPEINKKLNISFNADSLDLMESSLSKKGAQYELLQKMPFEL